MKFILKKVYDSMSSNFGEIKKNFGFGCMRLPMDGDKVNYSEFNRMIDAFIGAGFNYFDTAHGYLGGKSETAIRDCLAARYPRDAFILANKLSFPYFDKEDDIVPLFENQLKWCGVEYFDFYLFHAINRGIYPKYKNCNAFSIVENLKDQGKIHHIAMSFHDTADVLDMILSENPCIEAVQLMINYLDYDDPEVQSKACYDVAVKHGKKVIVMEPVRGGALVNLPKEGADILDRLGSGSYASYALRYAASYSEVIMVLSGMGNMDMMNDNIRTMGSFVPLNEEELAATDRVREIIRRFRQIKCTACEYCLDQCPKKIKIPKVFEAYNGYLAAKVSRAEAKKGLPAGTPASDCIKCGACERICPQHIDIRKNLERIARDLK